MDANVGVLEMKTGVWINVLYKWAGWQDIGQDIDRNVVSAFLKDLHFKLVLVPAYEPAKNIIII